MRARFLHRALVSGAAVLALSGSLTAAAGGASAASAGAAAPAAVTAGRYPHPVPRGVYVHHLRNVPSGRAAIMIPRNKRSAVPQTATNMTYHNGQVQSYPQVWIVFWGSWWSSTCAGSQGHGGSDEGYLYSYFHALGWEDDGLSPISTQYHDQWGEFPTFPSAIWGGWIVDCGDPPSSATQSQLASEAATFAGWFHANESATINSSTQIIIVSPSGTNPGGGFGNKYCAWHSYTSYNSADLSYTNLPYMPDQGSNCGANWVQGPMDGWSIVAGHEFAESDTDPWLNAWYDSDGEEIGDKCAWTDLFAESLSGSLYAQQPEWDNHTTSCQAHSSIPDNVSMNSISNQTTAYGSPATIQAFALSSQGFMVTYGAGGLPGNVSINSSNGTISGTPHWPGNYSVFVYATDPVGGYGHTSFTWAVVPAHGAIKSYTHTAHCVNDNKGSLASGTPVNLWGCNGTLAQQWATYPDKTLRRYGGPTHINTGKCVSIAGSKTANGSKVDLELCKSTWNQIWTYNSTSHRWVNPHTGKCLADPGGKLTNGTQLVLYSCNSKSWEMWSNV